MSFRLTVCFFQGEVITTVSASDVDTGDYGKVLYSLEAEGHAGEFAINSTTVSIF